MELMREGTGCGRTVDPVHHHPVPLVRTLQEGPCSPVSQRKGGWAGDGRTFSVGGEYRRWGSESRYPAGGCCSDKDHAGGKSEISLSISWTGSCCFQADDGHSDMTPIEITCRPTPIPTIYLALPSDRRPVQNRGLGGFVQGNRTEDGRGYGRWRDLPRAV
jgi:hypothetical protein